MVPEYSPWDTVLIAWSPPVDTDISLFVSCKNDNENFAYSGWRPHAKILERHL